MVFQKLGSNNVFDSWATDGIQALSLSRMELTVLNYSTVATRSNKSIIKFQHISTIVKIPKLSPAPGEYYAEDSF